MELAFILAYWLLIRSIGTTVGNTAALLRGGPVQVSRTMPARTGAPGATEQVAVGPSYTGRAIGTVAAVVKESFAAGVASGLDTGKAKYEARVERRAAKKAAKAGATADDAGGVPELATTDTPPEGSAGPAEAPQSPQEALTLDTFPGPADTGDGDGVPAVGSGGGEPRRSLWELLEDNKPIAPGDPRPRWMFREGCPITGSGGAKCGREPHPESYLRMCAEHYAEDLTWECPLTYSTSFGTRERLQVAGRCWYEKSPRRGYCGRKAAKESARGLCAAHDPAVTGGVPVIDIPIPGLSCGTCGHRRADHCPACQTCLTRNEGRHLADCPVAEGDTALVDPATLIRINQSGPLAVPPPLPPPPDDPTGEAFDLTATAKKLLRHAHRCTWVIQSGPEGAVLCGQPVQGGELCQEHLLVWCDERWAERAHDTATTTAAEDDGPAEQPDRPEPSGTVLYLLPRGQSGGGDHDKEEPPVDPSVPEPQARAEFKGVETTMTVTSGETTTIGATRAYFTELAKYTEEQILSQLDLASSTLQTAELTDPVVLERINSVKEAYTSAMSELQEALKVLNDNHSLMEEAVQSTPHAAKRDFYKE